ncbi:methylated-DNA-[protein]-cysteine S-methyltransferase [Caldanaerovirga acetigignens]|uniref:Methylated-DNA--protein-cysteine methyltransferase n=1 Tax=Caldanaerovirga acetigignens TaxID=447595 RepID=A0A1M7LHS4_9FIRM|nr:methylated-DNA--[protein]-cysteine S-methyltransferase [Caldanaerovirga acetigignens]SHM77170.1 methylated-DNA-[protein]-cysteine S-methyltransferase [Caldanaerovirga acetigignens]
MVYIGRVKTPLGIFIIASNEKGIIKLSLPGERETDFLGELERLYGKLYILDEDDLYSPINKRLKEELLEYLGGRRKNFTVPLDLKGTTFQKRVWDELLKIPYGKVKSYGQIARELGKPGAARAVGLANNRNPVPILVPCHRVVGSDGSLVGYGGGLEFKKFLLKLEGVRFSGERCIMEY